MTIQTMSLDPLAILGDVSRLPENMVERDARTPRPAWIGEHYRPGGVVLLGKNPGGGAATHIHVRSVADAATYSALGQLNDRRNLEAYRHWREEEGKALPSWNFWRSISAVLGALKLSRDEVAIGNLLPLRTRDNRVRISDLRQAWHLNTASLIALLQPRLIIRMTADFRDDLRRLAPPGCQVCGFSRANGDSHITAAGQRDLAEIAKHAL